MKKSVVIFLLFWGVSIFFIFRAQKEKIHYKDKTYNIGILVMATGPYIEYAQTMIDSAQQYLLPNHNVTFFVFTDQPLQETKNIKKIYQERMGWPYDTLVRSHIYYEHKEKYSDMDYVFACDADMLFVDMVGEELLYESVAVIQLASAIGQKPYERNALSMACVNRGEETDYYAGAFYGGTYKSFLYIVKTMKDSIDIDLARGIIACSNDESHLNRYFINNKPTQVLSPSYCHFSTWRSPFKKKILAIAGKPETDVRMYSNVSPLAFFKGILEKNRKKT